MIGKVSLRWALGAGLSSIGPNQLDQWAQLKDKLKQGMDKLPKLVFLLLHCSVQIPPTPLYSHQQDTNPHGIKGQ